MRRIVALGWMWALTLFVGTGLLRADDDEAEPEVPAPIKASAGGRPRPSDNEKKYKDFGELTRGAQKHDGFFTLHQKDDHLYAEIKPQQLDQPLLAPIAIARGMQMAGQPLNFGDEWVLVFKRVGDRVQLIRRNIHYKAPSNSPLDKAVKQNYTDSILMALPVLSVNHGNNNSVVIDFSDIFFGDFAQLGFGNVDRSRTSWHKVKTFPNNVELEVEATYTGGRFFSYYYGDDGVADHRGRTIVIHYSLDKLPDSGYKPRYADDRVGHFLSANRDFGSNDLDTNFVRQVNRWRIEKADPKAKLSPPKKQLIWYVENNVPNEYRPFVEEGILEWNKAFEKAGIRNALAVRWQEEGRDDFDPEDINYCTFRWITTNMTYAMSCLRANPLTGEMIDGDVIFDASWIRYWKEEYAFLAGNAASPAGVADGSDGRRDGALRPLALGRVISPIMAAKQGYGLPFPLPSRQNGLDGVAAGADRPELIPAAWNDLQVQLRRRQASGQFGACQYSTGMRAELGFAAVALAGAAPADDDDDNAPADQGEDKDKDKDKAKDQGNKDDKDKDKAKEKEKSKELKLPDDFLGQMIKEVVMHEVGHSLGLRHNFKASVMLDPEQLNDTAITRAKGQTGSVMDYNPINLAPKGKKQGDYTTTTIGPYDYWAIEYAYKSAEGDEAAELKKIAARSPDPDLAYATDEDMFLDNDPYVNTYDLGSDTLCFAKDRIGLAGDLLKDLDAKVVKDGEAWTRLRSAFSVLLAQWGNGAYLAAEHVGGQSVTRDHKGDKGARDPIVPVKAAKQRDALTFVSDQILSDRAFRFSPALLRKLATERWYHWGNEMFFMSGGVEYPIHEEILAIQKIVLGQCLSADVLSRLQNQETLADAGTEPLRMAEVFRSLTDSIWSEASGRNEPVADGDPNPKKLALSTIRRNLQREHLRKLCTIVLGRRRSPYEDLYDFVIFFGGSGQYPADAKSLARMHLREIGGQIDRTLKRNSVALDDTTRAHFEECQSRISKVLDATLQANEP